MSRELKHLPGKSGGGISRKAAKTRKFAKCRENQPRTPKCCFVNSHSRNLQNSVFFSFLLCVLCASAANLLFFTSILRLPTLPFPFPTFFSVFSVSSCGESSLLVGLRRCLVSLTQSRIGQIGFRAKTQGSQSEETRWLLSRCSVQIRKLIRRHQDANGAGLPGDPGNQPPFFQGQHHLVDAGRRHPEEPLHVSLAGRLPVNLGVVVDEGQVLSLLVSELLLHQQRFAQGLTRVKVLPQAGGRMIATRPPLQPHSLGLCWEAPMRNLAGKIRFACRMLLKHPAFTLISLTVLALGTKGDSPHREERRGNTNRPFCEHLP